MKSLLLVILFIPLITVTNLPQRKTEGQTNRETPRERESPKQNLPQIEERKTDQKVPQIEVINKPGKVSQIEDREHPKGHPQRKPRDIVIEPPLRNPKPPDNEEPPVYDEQPDYEEPEDSHFECILICREGDNLPEGIVFNKSELLKIEGIEKFEEEKFAEALLDFCNALAENPADSDLYFYRGCTNVKLQNYLWAIEDLDIYLKYYLHDIDSSMDKEALYYRALAKYYSKEKEDAYFDFDASAKLGDLRAKIFLRRFY